MSLRFISFIAASYSNETSQKMKIYVESDAQGDVEDGAQLKILNSESYLQSSQMKSSVKGVKSLVEI